MRGRLCSFVLPVVMGAALAGAAAANEDVLRKVDEAVESGKFDLSVVKAVNTLPRDERLAAAAELAESGHPAMRTQAVLILRNLPAPAVTKVMRKLLEDEDVTVRVRAAAFLAKKAGDTRARDLLVEQCRNSDPRVAASALSALGQLRGKEVAGVLRELMLDRARDRAARAAAMLAAGNARAEECTAALVQLLDDKSLRKMHAKDTMRMCDLAAAALEQIHRVNYIGKPGSYFTASVEARDRGIEIWRKWHVDRGGQAMGREVARVKYVDAVLRKCLEKLSGTPSAEERRAVRTALTATLKTRLCLGDMPGVDAVVAPSVGDLWRMLQVMEEKSWYKLLNCWRELEHAYKTKFLPGYGGGQAAPDRQAADFVLFAGGEPRFPRIWAWSLCRDFAEVYPKSKHGGGVAALRVKVETEFEEKKMQVVLHGRIAVLEPNRGRTEEGMVPSGGTALANLMDREPSNWAAHRNWVEYMKRFDRHLPVYWFLRKMSDLYPGNEWLFLGDAIYQQRIRKDSKRALTAADKALILNPENAKAHAVKGMILLASGGSKDVALRELRRAYELDPTSIGGEPETLEAAVLLLEGMREGGRGDPALCAKTLGELRVMGSSHPLKSDARFRASSSAAARAAD